MKTEFEATSFRLKNLEQELSWMRKNIQESKDNLAKHTCNNIISSCKSESFRMLRMDKHFESMRCRKDMGISTCTGARKWVSHRQNFAHKISHRRPVHTQVKESLQMLVQKQQHPSQGNPTKVSESASASSIS
jgi:hypothetical protein